MHIQVLSDLHLEFSRPDVAALPGSSEALSYTVFEYDFPAKAEVLALLGDIGVTRDDRFFDWLRSQLKRFKLVFFLSGNHEPYRSSLEESSRRFTAFVQECDELTRNPPQGENVGQFVLLDRTRYDLSDTVTVLGCTLWSRLDPDNIDLVRIGLNDFRQIEGFTPEVYQTLHQRDVQWLQEAVTQISRDEPHRKIVIMTHHAPTVEGTSNPKYAGGPISSAFSTELSNESWWNMGVKVWMFGHTHWPCDFERNGVRVLSNARGYRSVGEDGFESDMVVEV